MVEAVAAVLGSPGLEGLGEPGTHPRHRPLLHAVERREVQEGARDEEGDGQADLLQHQAQLRVRPLQTQPFPFRCEGVKGKGAINRPIQLRPAAARGQLADGEAEVAHRLACLLGKPPHSL